jgi:hypothetical protein
MQGSYSYRLVKQASLLSDWSSSLCFRCIYLCKIHLDKLCIPPPWTLPRNTTRATDQFYVSTHTYLVFNTSCIHPLQYPSWILKISLVKHDEWPLEWSSWAISRTINTYKSPTLGSANYWLICVRRRRRWTNFGCYTNQSREEIMRKA